MPPQGHDDQASEAPTTGVDAPAADANAEAGSGGDWMERYGVATQDNVCYPAPADWVLDHADMDGVRWERIPGLGNGLATRAAVQDVLDEGETVADVSAESAALWFDLVHLDLRERDDTTRYTLKIDGERVFRREDAERADLYATTAEALALYSNGGDHTRCLPETGRPPAELRDLHACAREERRLHKQESNHHPLTEF